MLDPLTTRSRRLHRRLGVGHSGRDLAPGRRLISSPIPGLKLLLRASRRPEAAPMELGLHDFETRFPGIAMSGAVPLTLPASEFQLTRSPTLKALIMTTRFNAWQWELPQRLEFSEL